jgi:hypothetical protein
MERFQTVLYFSICQKGFLKNYTYQDTKKSAKLSKDELLSSPLLSRLSAFIRDSTKKRGSSRFQKNNDFLIRAVKERLSYETL